MFRFFSKIAVAPTIAGVALLVLAAGAARADYTPPVGIPAPPFGIDEVAPAQPSAWPSASASGFYYVDNSHPQATDSSNTYGYPSKPRMSIPTSLPAGSYVEIHGGPYVASTMQITSSGTSSAPVFVHGDPTNKPIIRAMLGPAGSYAIFENLKFDTNDRTVRLAQGVHHVAIRNCEFTGPGTNYGNNSVIATGGSSGARSHDLVIYNNVIRNFGDKSVSASENDFHGVLPGSYTDNVWILNNTAYNLGGDGVQVGQATFSTAERPTYVYIGGNTFYANRENAIDVKRSSNVVMSQNDCRDFWSTSTSPGEAIVIHNDAANVWVIANTIYRAAYGIVTTGSSDTYFIGNVIHSIRHEGSFDSGSMYSPGAAIHLRGTTNASYVIGNTIDNCSVGIEATTSNPVHLYNNIFSNRTEPSGKDVFYSSPAASSSDMDYNFFYGGANPVRISWGDGTDRNAAGFTSRFSPKGAHIPAEADPRYINRSANDYRLQTGSTAKDTGVYVSAYSAYQLIYGASLQKDFTGNPRPSGTGWDIGAYEIPSGGTIRLPLPPTGFLIH